VLAADSRRIAVFTGRGSDSFRASLAARVPELENRIHAVKTTCAGTLSSYLAACDVLVQPYPDGVTTRRGSLMAGLALGKPIVAVAGKLTETIWAESKAVALAPGNSEAIVSSVNSLLADSAARRSLGDRAAALYADRFALRHTVRTLLSQS
jgi:glycosyltransferase involved in cell wall biosynthesis